MRRAITWVYCEPKSRIRILECFGAAAVFMDASSARCVLRQGRGDRAAREQFLPDLSDRVAVAIELRCRFVARADRRSHRRPACRRSQSGSTRASSAHFKNELLKSKSTSVSTSLAVLFRLLL